MAELVSASATNSRVPAVPGTRLDTRIRCTQELGGSVGAPRGGHAGLVSLHCLDAVVNSWSSFSRYVGMTGARDARLPCHAHGIWF